MVEGFQVKASEVKAEFRVSEEYLRKQRYVGILIQGVPYK
jgi:hypothetical protein